MSTEPNVVANASRQYARRRADGTPSVLKRVRPGSPGSGTGATSVGTGIDIGLDTGIGVGVGVRDDMCSFLRRLCWGTSLPAGRARHIT
ncbi:hypothetical protein [Streptomyces sp. WAC08241]|uniref:hypothetical protein n=1 Tax=Streptomyces sp. WAC08241 TaxID=2487421 RepID=UPI0021AFA23B|nr:hypothetical protein [Streptomyces sp. WAC08241]